MGGTGSYQGNGEYRGREAVDVDARPIRASVARTCYMSFRQGNSGYRGTGFIFDWNIGGTSMKFVMTCAHNLGDCSGGYLTLSSDVTCYTLWNGYDYAKKYRVVKSFVHPAW